MLRSVVNRLILPKGKVHVNYTRFVTWSFVSNIIISAESVLSTHSMLSAVNQSSTEAIITANYIGKDILGQLGGLIYVNRFGKTADTQPKKFLKYSNAFQQVSMMAECITPLINIQYFLPIAGTANMFKNISFVGFGSTNVKCLQIMAQEDNLGEMYAKLSVVNTLGSSIGMLTGLYITAAVPDHTTRLAFIPVLGFLRMFTIKKAVSCVLIDIDDEK
jgi:hypothetical protein